MENIMIRKNNLPSINEIKKYSLVKQLMICKVITLSSTDDYEMAAANTMAEKLTKAVSEDELKLANTVARDAITFVCSNKFIGRKLSGGIVIYEVAKIKMSVLMRSMLSDNVISVDNNDKEDVLKYFIHQAKI